MLKVFKWQNQTFNLDLSDCKGLCSFPYTSLFLSITRKRCFWNGTRGHVTPQATKTGIFLQQPWQDVVCGGCSGLPARWCGAPAHYSPGPWFRMGPGKAVEQKQEAGSRKELGQGVVSQGCPKLPLTIPSFGLVPWLHRNVLT